MSGGNPDSIVSLHSSNGVSDDIDTLNLETVVEELNIGMEDEESTPVAPQTPDTDLSSSIAPAAEVPNFNHTNAKVKFQIILIYKILIIVCFVFRALKWKETYVGI